MTLVAFAASAEAADSRTWTDVRGEFRIEAEFVRLSEDGKQVTLRSANGLEMTVLRDRLTADDQKYLDALPPAERQGQTRGGVQSLTGARRAVLVGVNEYQNLRDLKFCGADVRALAQQLIASGFDKDKVVVIHDSATRSLQPDKEKIINQISLTLEAAESGDLVLVAFAGHGVRVGGKSYLAPYEAQIPKASDDKASLDSLIPLDVIYDKLKASSASMKLFLVDACQERIVPGDSRGANSRAAEGISRSLGHVPEGILQLTACAPGEFSQESDELGHGVFTHFLMQALAGEADQDHDGIVSLKEADLYTSRQTEQYVRAEFSQTQRPSMRGELQGDLPLAICPSLKKITVPTDCATLHSAMRRAAKGATITVQPGVYRMSEPLVIKQDLTLVGGGSGPSEVTLEGKGTSAVIVEGGKVHIQGLSLNNEVDPAAVEALVAPRVKQLEELYAKTVEGTDAWAALRRERRSLEHSVRKTLCEHVVSALDVVGGNVQLVQCHMTSDGGAGARITGAKARIAMSQCTVKKSHFDGVGVYDSAEAALSDCDVGNCQRSCVLAMSGGQVSLEGCKLHDAVVHAVEVINVSAVVADCDMFATGDMAVWLEASTSTLRGCKIHDSAAGGIYMTMGSKGTITGCELYDNARNGMHIDDGSDPNVERCTFRNSEGYGVWVTNNGKGRFVDCDVFGNASSGICVAEDSDPRVERCKIHDGKQNGIFVLGRGKGQFVDCDVFGNAYSGIAVKEDSDPKVERCKFHDGKQGGIWVTESGRGTFVDCDIFHNTFSGIGSDGAQVDKEADPRFERCTFRESRECGVWVTDNGKGRFVDCDMYGNGYSGMVVNNGADPMVERCKFHDGQSGGIFVNGRGKGTFIDCDIFGNAHSGAAVMKDADPRFERCKFHDGEQGGVYVHDNGKGTFVECDIFRNTFAGFESKQGGDPTVERCTLRDGKSYGILVQEDGKGTYLNNTLRNNSDGNWKLDGAGTTNRRGNRPNQ